jgi:hypothetical protein
MVDDRKKINRKRNMESELEEKRELEEEKNVRERAGSTLVLHVDVIKERRRKVN